MKTMKRTLSRNQKRAIYILSIILFSALMLVLSAVVGKPLVQYASDPDKFVAWIDSYGVYSQAIFVMVVTLQVIIAVIPGGPFEVAAGYAFGVVEGTILTTIGIVIGCYICFLLVRSVSADFIEVFFNEKDIEKISFLRDTDKLKRFAFILNLIPGIPKDLLSYLAGLTDISLSAWLIAVFSGRLPAIIVSCLSGSILQDGNIILTVVIFCFFGICSLAGFKIYDNMQKKYSERKKEGITDSNH